MKILVTGSAGFIGSHVVIALLNKGYTVCGVDNHNDYYDPQIKEDRLARFVDNSQYTHYRVDLSDKTALERVFEFELPDRVINLAAQAGVRYSMENPMAYIDSNITGFAHILENCRNFNIKHLVYASSSSVYGANSKMPFSIHDNVDHPLSLYAASKKANELMAHTYSHLYNIPTTGLRFFTVYGPWGRPDMALFKFAKAIIERRPIDVFNYGHHRRDFTYIDDIVEAIVRIVEGVAKPNLEWSSEKPDPGSSLAPWRVFNIGNSRPVELLDYIKAIEEALGQKAEMNLLPMQLGDVPDTYADVRDLEVEFNYKPNTAVEDGISKFVAWYRAYYGV